MRTFVKSLIPHKDRYLFKQIFINNNNEMIKQFFNDSYIRSIWPFVILNMKKKSFVNKKTELNPFTLKSLDSIKGILIEQYDIILPTWWDSLQNI